MPDTGFRQTGGHVRANWLASSNLLFVANYLSSRQDDANRWDQILGGDGNLIAELNDLQLDLFYGRIESLSAGCVRPRLGHLLGQHAARRARQPGRQRQPERDDRPRAGAHERSTACSSTRRSSCSPRQSLLVGGDAYFEKLTSPAFDVNPVTGAESPRRPRVPDNATYKQGGFFGQLSYRRQARPVRGHGRRPRRVQLLHGEGVRCADRQRPSALA